MTDHEHLFPEEQEPSGRLILTPCLQCGMPALEGLHFAKVHAAKILADAPHDSACLIDWAGEGDSVHHYPNAGTCDCWKAGIE